MSLKWPKFAIRGGVYFRLKHIPYEAITSMQSCINKRIKKQQW